MNIKRAKQEIKDSIEAYLLRDEQGDYVIPGVRQRPILLLGAPGIGKTQIMEQIARECQIGLVAYTITHHTRQSAIGLPFITHKEFGGREYAVTEYTMSEIVASVYEKMEKTGLKEGILFIDEINCVSETLAPAMLQFLQCKTFGNQAIPQGWIIVAAGNPPEYNKSVRDFDVVTMDRVKKIEVEPDYSVWKEYAREQSLHPAVIAYLDAHPGRFYQMETTVDGKRFATPRGWEDLSELLMIYEKLGKAVDWEVVVQYIQHPKTARDFANYLELYKKYQADYQIDQILGGRMDELLMKKTAHASFDERLSVISLLLAKCTEAFRRTEEQDWLIQALFPRLQNFKALLGEGGADPAACMDQIRDDIWQEQENKEQAELLSRKEKKLYQQLLAQVEAYGQMIRQKEARTSELALALVRAAFDSMQDVREESVRASGRMLEHAFDFMEAAFGDSQEMVVFVTELNISPVCVRFLREYECDRYYQYNQRLLVNQAHRQLRSRIEELKEGN